MKDESFGGTGSYQNIGDAVTWLRTIDPKSILDVGCGFGRWGFLSREFLEIWNGRLKRSNFQVKITGVDAHPASFSAHHQLFYDELHGMPIETFLQTNDEEFDLVILGDVIEHLQKSSAYEVIDTCLQRAKYILMVVPIGANWEQDSLYDNIYERHLAVWEVEDTEQFNPIASRLYFDYIQRPFLMTVLTREDPWGLKSKLSANYSQDVLRKKELEDKRKQGAGKVETSQKMHVAFVSPEYMGVNQSGGIGTYIHHLSRILINGGHEVSVVTIGEGGEQIDGGVRILTVPLASIQPSHGHDFSGLERNFKWSTEVLHALQKLNQEHPVDVVEVTDFYMEGLFLRGSQALKRDGQFIPVVTHMHGPLSFVLSLNRQMIPQLYEQMDSYNLNSAMFLKANSPSWAETVGRLWPGSQCEFVRGPYIEESSATSQKGPGKPEWDLLYFGRLEVRKGVKILIDALGLIPADKLPRVCFIGKDLPLPGSNSTMGAYLNQQLKDLYGDKLTVFNEVPHEELPDYISRARVAVFPSTWESLGYTAIETMQMGKPTLISRKSGISYIVPEEIKESCILDPDDVQSMSTRIQQMLIKGDAELVKLGELQRKALLKEFAETAVLEDSVAYYRSCIEQSKQTEPENSRVTEDSFQVLVQYLSKYSLNAGINTSRLRSAEMTGMTLKYVLKMNGDGKKAALDELRRSLTALKPHQHIERTQHQILVYALSAEGVGDNEPEKQAALLKVPQLLIQCITNLAENGYAPEARRLLSILQSSDNHILSYQVASTLKNMGEFDGAYGVFEKLLENKQQLSKPVLGGVYFHLGELCSARGDMASARKNFSECLKLIPGHSKARESLESLS